MTIVSPGVVVTELGHDITDANSKSFVADLRKNALTADAIARSVLYAIAQPEDVDVNEIVVRPIGQSF